jgi:hypothetical protein
VVPYHHTTHHGTLPQHRETYGCLENIQFLNKACKDPRRMVERAATKGLFSGKIMTCPSADPAATTDLPCPWDRTAYCIHEKRCKGRRGNQGAVSPSKITRHWQSARTSFTHKVHPAKANPRKTDLPVRAKDVIPQHGILSVVGLRDAMMYVVGFGIKDGQASHL